MRCVLRYKYDSIAVTPKIVYLLDLSNGCVKILILNKLIRISGVRRPLVNEFPPTSIIGSWVGALRQVYFLMDHRVRSFMGLTDKFGLFLKELAFNRLIRNGLW